MSQTGHSRTRAEEPENTAVTLALVEKVNRLHAKLAAYADGAVEPDDIETEDYMRNTEQES